MKTTCPYCGVGCGVEVSSTAGDSFLVVGDSTHPANRGKLCSKGAALADTLNHEGRLLYPEINGERVSWDHATDHVATALTQTIERYGRESVAFYVSGQLLTEDYYVLNKFTKGWLGTANIDTNSRLCMASSVVGHKRAFGTDTVPVSYEDVEKADLIILVGSNLAWCHPVLYQRIVAAKRRRPEMFIVVIDPRRTMTADAADLYLPIKPDGDTTLFNGLLTYLSDQGVCDLAYLDAHVNGFRETLHSTRGWTVKRVATAIGVETGLIDTFYRRVRDTAKTVSIYSQGVNQSTSGSDKVNAIINCHLATGRIGKPGMGPFSVTGQPNAMGGREVGGLATQLTCHMELDNAQHRHSVQRFWQSPAIADRAGLCAVDLFKAVADGRIKALWVLGTNPVDSLPEADSVRKALQVCPLVIMSDVTAHTDTMAYAQVRLPAQAWGEKDGTVTNSERCISRQRRFKTPAGQAQADWWAVAQVAGKMGYANAFAYRGAADIFREHATLSGADNAGARAFDISACAALDNRAYDALQPFYWPWKAGKAPTRPLRFFGKGGFFTQDHRARMLPVKSAAAGNIEIDDLYPLIMNTGRNRDQWHTMTRTGYSVRLARHLAEPYVAMHPQDALLHGICDADLVRVSSEHASVLVRALLTDRQQAGQIFVPMHWSEQFASHARIGALVAVRLDPWSQQPASKNTAVRMQLFSASSYAFGLLRHQPDFKTQTEIDYWAIAPIDGGWQYEAASSLSVEALRRQLTQLSAPPADGVPNELEWLSSSDLPGGRAAVARFGGRRLQALLFVADTPVSVSRSWARQQLETTFVDRSKRWQLLAGRADSGQADKGAIVCSCYSVGTSEIARAVDKQGCTNLDAIGTALQAGTNCGSCRGEIQSIINQCTHTLKRKCTTSPSRIT